MNFRSARARERNRFRFYMTLSEPSERKRRRSFCFSCLSLFLLVHHARKKTVPHNGDGLHVLPGVAHWFFLFVKRKRDNAVLDSTILYAHFSMHTWIKIQYIHIYLHTHTQLITVSLILRSIFQKKWIISHTRKSGVSDQKWGSWIKQHTHTICIFPW